MRLYAPKAEALVGKWNPPPVVKQEPEPALITQLGGRLGRRALDRLVHRMERGVDHERRDRLHHLVAADDVAADIADRAGNVDDLNAGLLALSAAEARNVARLTLQLSPRFSYRAKGWN
jgi:hypothetical protein